MCDGEGLMGLQVKVKIPELIAGDMSTCQKTGSRQWIRRRYKSGGKLGESGN